MTKSPLPYIGEGAITPYPRREVFLRILWSLVQSTLFRWSPRPCHRWRVELLRIFGAEIPEPALVEVYPSVEIVFPWKLTLEAGAMVGPSVKLYNLARITLRYGANISQNSHLCAGTHDYTKWSMPLITREITLERNVWVATEVFVGPGVTIGELAVVGARSVVLKDLPPRMVCAGHPCRPLKPRPDPT